MGQLNSASKHRNYFVKSSHFKLESEIWWLSQSSTLFTSSQDNTQDVLCRDAVVLVGLVPADGAQEVGRRHRSQERQQHKVPHHAESAVDHRRPGRLLPPVLQDEQVFCSLPLLDDASAANVGHG